MVRQRCQNLPVCHLLGCQLVAADASCARAATTVLVLPGRLGLLLLSEVVVAGSMVRGQGLAASPAAGDAACAKHTQ
jgi:hypothetical protein